MLPRIITTGIYLYPRKHFLTSHECIGPPPVHPSVLSCHDTLPPPPPPLPLGPVSIDEKSVFSSHTYYPKEPQALVTKLLERINALRAHVDTRLPSSQNRRKRDRDKHVRRSLVFAPGKLVYLVAPPLSASSTKDISKIATTKYSKL